MGDFGTPLCKLAHHFHQIGTSLGEFSDIFVSGGQHQWNSTIHSVVQQADAVGEAGVDVQVDQGGDARGTAISIGHTHRHAFLSHQHILDVPVV